MSLSKPLIDVNWGAFFIRVPLGLYLFLAGWKKYGEHEIFIEVVKSMHVVPEHFSVLFAVLLPYAEMLSGLLLFFGFLTTFAAVISSLILLSIVFAFGLNPEGASVFNKDILILAASLSLLATGGGALSIDEFRSGGK